MAAIPFSKRFREQYPRFTRVFLLSVCFLGAFSAGLAYASWAMVCRAGRCPPAQALQDYEPRQTSKILAADGRFIAELGLERRTLVKIADVPPLVRDAFVVTEDQRFFAHFITTRDDEAARSLRTLVDLPASPEEIATICKAENCAAALLDLEGRKVGSVDENGTIALDEEK